MRKWLARLEGTIYWPHYEWQINSKPIEIKDVIAATISSYQQLLGVPVNKDFDFLQIYSNMYWVQNLLFVLHWPIGNTKSSYTCMNMRQNELKH